MAPARIEVEMVVGPDALEAFREVAREEIASLCGLVLRRLQDVRHPDSLDGHDLEEIFGEALADFSSHTTGEQPGPVEPPDAADAEEGIFPTVDEPAA